jgi:hypothetical protein
MNFYDLLEKYQTTLVAKKEPGSPWVVYLNEIYIKISEESSYMPMGAGKTVAQGIVDLIHRVRGKRAVDYKGVELFCFPEIITI